MRKSRIKNKKKFKFILILVLFIGIGFAAISKNIDIIGTATFNIDSVKVYFNNGRFYQNAVSTSGDYEVIVPKLSTKNHQISNDKLTVNYNMTVDETGTDELFLIDVVNDSKFDVKITEIVDNSATVNLPSDLVFSVKYANGSNIGVNDGIRTGETVTVAASLKSLPNVRPDQLTGTSGTYNMSLTLKFQKADANTNYVGTEGYTPTATVIQSGPTCNTTTSTKYTAQTPICRRASSLHTETCTRTAYGCYEKYGTGGSIQYGNCGIAGELNPGDAFDCDVNGDGTYDANTERFYYISPRDGEVNSGYATLIYSYSMDYNYTTNVSSICEINSTYHYYECSTISREYSDQSYGNTRRRYISGNTNSYLPNREMWPAVRLLNNHRIINDLNSNAELINLSDEAVYKGNAARLLNSKELLYMYNKSQEYKVEQTEAYYALSNNNHIFDDYPFLFEHTNYNLTDPNINKNYLSYSSNNNDYIFIEDMYGSSGVGIDSVSSRKVIDYYRGTIRPAIEVDINNISY